MPQFVAFLRGINLGKRNIKMDDLRAAFADMGFANTRTLIASGNVLFEAEQATGLSARIAAGLENTFGFDIATIVRSVTQLEDMVKSDPFKGKMSDADTKYYVYFLADGITPDAEKLPANIKGDFEVIATTSGEIFAAGYRVDKVRFGPGLDALPKPFGKNITNRNWNTIHRLIEKAKS